MFSFICIISTLLSLSEGHGRLTDPPGRATAWRYGFDTPIDYQDNEQFCGGREYQHEKMGGKCGVCGDKYDVFPRPHEAGGKYATGTIVKSYKQGQTITVTVQLTTNHKGYFEFRLCPVNDRKVAATEECLEEHVLRQTNGRIRFPLETWENKFYDVEVKLPADLTCKQCVLQWKYVAGNTWGCWKSDVTSRWLYTPRATCCTGCGNEQEQFYGCADISILPDYNPPRTTDKEASTRNTTTTLRPTTTTTTTTKPTTTATTSQKLTTTKPATTSRSTTTLQPTKLKTTTSTTRKTATTTTSNPSALSHGSRLCSFLCNGKSSFFCPKECAKGENDV